MLTVALCSALLCSTVTPPRVNTGLEVSSTDKNTPTSQQRGIHARIPLSCFRKNVTLTHKFFKSENSQNKLPDLNQSDRNYVYNNASCLTSVVLW